MATFGDLVRITGQSPLLVARLTEPLHRALDRRSGPYTVHVESLGRVGDVLISITGSRGHVPLILRAEDLEPGYVFRVVEDTVERFGY